MSPFPMPEVTCPEPGDVVHYTDGAGSTHWASIISPPNELGIWAVRAFDACGELGPTGAPGDRLALVAKGREGSPPPFAVGDVVDYRDSDQDEAPGTYRGTITGLPSDDGRWHVDLDNGGEEVAAPHELTLVRRKDDDEAPDCTRCGHPMSEHTGRGNCCEDLPCACYGYSKDPGAEMPPKDAPRMFYFGQTVDAGPQPPEPAPEYDVVEKAEHYNRHPSGIECIDVVRHMGFNLGNAVKYVWRADLKHNAIEDLKKARYYLDDEIARRERQAAGE